MALAPLATPPGISTDRLVSEKEVALRGVHQTTIEQAAWPAESV
jgi:hypothetical protein